MTTHTKTSQSSTRRVGITDRSPLGDLASEVTLYVEPESSVRDAAATMEREGVSSLLVAGTGIVTERDLVRAISHGISPSEAVGNIATAHPVVVSGALSVVDGCATMLAEGVRHLVVDIGGGRLGVVSIRDVLAVLIHSTTPQVWLSSLRMAVPVSSATTTEVWLG